MQSKTNVKTGGGDPSDKANHTQTMMNYSNSESKHFCYKASLWFPGLLVLALVVSSFVIFAFDKPLMANACDTRLLRGDYGFSFSGSFSGGVIFTGVGSESCDAKGQCTGVTTINIDGATSTAPFTSVYTINADCTGVETADYYDLGLIVSEAVTIVDGGKEVHFMGTDAGGTSLGVMKRR
jgi:hypothetical protein